MSLLRSPAQPSPAESWSYYCSGFDASIHITDWVLASKVGHTHCRDEDDWGNAVHVFLTGDQHYHMLPLFILVADVHILTYFVCSEGSYY